MAFTTWTALYNSMLDDLATGSWKVKSYTLENQTAGSSRSHTYRDLSDFKDFLAFVKSQADVETSSAAGRTYAKQGGGGRW